MVSSNRIYKSKEECPWCGQDSWYCYIVDESIVPSISNCSLPSISPIIDLNFVEYNSIVKPNSLFDALFFDECVSCGAVVS